MKGIIKKYTILRVRFCAELKKQLKFIVPVIILFLCVNIGLAGTVAEPNLVSWWKLDDGGGTIATDSINNYDGTLTGDPQWTTGKTGGALDFDGDDAVYINSSAGQGSALNIYNSDITICAWVNPRSDGTIVARAKSSYITYRLFVHSAGKAGINYYAGGSHYFLFTDEIISFGGWYHIVGVFDRLNNVGKVYVNGIEEATGSLGDDPPSCDATNKIGCRNDTTDVAFDGTIDDVRIYNKALSPEEIEAVYLGGFYKAYNPNPFESETGVDPNLVLSWRPGMGAISHDIYFGTDYNDVNEADTLSIEYMGNFDVNSFAPCGVEIMTTYYWRVDEVNDANSDVWKGNVWSFRTISPVIELSEAVFNFYAIKDGANPASQILTISNIGIDTLNWQINYDCNWLEVEPTVGSSTGEADDVTLCVDISTLSRGIYNCQLTISDPNASNNPQTVSVNLFVYNELLVPSEYGTIQSAIDAAMDGDTVIVAPGTYTGTGNTDINFKGKAITVRSENGPENCIIDCNGTYEENHRGFYFKNGESPDSVLEGFTITNAYVVVDCVAGAGIYIDDSSPIISNCIITNNHAVLMPESLCFCLGGGIYIGWGLNTGPGSNPIITDCIVSDNSVGDWGWGGGIFCDYLATNVTIYNSIISNNTALGHDGVGGGIYCDQTTNLTVINSIIVGNSATDEGGGIRFYGSTPTKTVANSIIRGNLPDQIYTTHTDTVQVLFSDVQGGWPGTGNIDADPYFADAGNGDYHLKSIAGRWDPNSQSWVNDDVTSPCIDAGNPGCPLGNEPNEINNIRINMGAYGGTATASKTPANWRKLTDLTNDWVVDLDDLSAFALYLLEGGECIASDLNRSQFVDFADYAIFAEDWPQ